MDWEMTTPRRDNNHINFVVWCILYQRFYGVWLSAGLWYLQCRPIYTQPAVEIISIVVIPVCWMLNAESQLCQKITEFHHDGSMITWSWQIMCNKACTLINLSWPNDTIWRHWSGSTLAQVMACCLTAPSHYLNQCWLVISKIQSHSSDGNFSKDISVIND